MTDRELMQQALEALELAYAGIDAITVHGKAITALRERLAQPQRTHWEGCEEVHPECKKQERERIIAANRPEIEKINAHIKALEKAVEDEREAIAQSLDKQADLAADEIDRQWAQEMAAAVRARSRT